MKHKFLWIGLFFFQIYAGQEIQILKLKPYQKAVLSDTLRESSGLTILQGKLLSFNDSGNAPEIYEINPERGNILKTYKTNAINQDWEAITHDEKHLYIGDFGNNLGVRKDLTIYKIPFIPDAEKLEYTAKIHFFYPEQQDYSPKNIRNNFDAEAMIFLNGKLHVFTKEWEAKAVSHYVIDPDIQDLQPAYKQETYPSGFVVTDATYFQGKLYLIGYTKSAHIYLLSCEETSPGVFFEGKIKKYFLGMATRFGQIEGVTATEEGLYISGEEFNFYLLKAKQRLYFLPFKKLK
ncbi:hypothetical protein GNY06_04575 [Elizabethkingia argentiflava]|uniref:T9SS C-terminal target domain-containing protein n=1 Tax=Elizabethkingia argenteiflava TaxID=2681556 RepID=A0A845PQW7_9FLAO|nr:hypothetical protein [Elizabethkingia argenteiflava]NAW50689.1 hypothetical protein [Elizabethkingia argenteiflava]